MLYKNIPMKNLVSICFILLTYSFSFSQSNPDFKQPNLSFKKCVDDENREKCFNTLIANKLTNSVKTEIKNYLEINKDKDYVVNRASFVVGENGKALIESIQTTNSKNTEVGNKLKRAILDLPEFSVRKNEYNHSLLSYYTIGIKNGIDENNEVIVLDINNKEKKQPNNSNQTNPIYPGCKSKDNEELKKCLSYNVSKIVGSNFKSKKALKRFKKKGSFYIYVLFAVDENGKLSNLKAFGPNKNFEKQALSALKKVKKITPGTKNGKNIKVFYSLPIKLKVAK